MRIATRLSLLFIVEVVVVLTVGVMLRWHTEQQTVLEEMVRNRRFFAHAICAAIVSSGHRTETRATARTVLTRAEVARAHIEVRLVSRSGAQGSTRFMEF